MVESTLLSGFGSGLEVPNIGANSDASGMQGGAQRIMTGVGGINGDGLRSPLIGVLKDIPAVEACNSNGVALGISRDSCVNGEEAGGQGGEVEELTHDMVVEAQSENINSGISSCLAGETMRDMKSDGRKKRGRPVGNGKAKVKVGTSGKVSQNHLAAISTQQRSPGRSLLHLGA
ncbi:hypothetical protein K1719_010304 [Acacia pycnantha]|nr:hypothetical protein K1719_010304 [Acacia pycnantha]